MTELTWSTPGQRFFETGVDKGVLYVGSDPGVAWLGLISITESPSGGEPTSYYMDGVKYLDSRKATEFEGNLTAFSAPAEFGPCQGIRSNAGLTITDQPKAPFGLCYRTQLGNDLRGVDYGYKIHLIYNAKAGTPSKDYSTLGDSVNPLQFSWPITATPIHIPTVRPAAHYEIDSTEMDPTNLTSLENIIYGTEFTDPRMPTADELAIIFGLTPTTPEEDHIFDGGPPDPLFDFVDSGGV